MDSVCHDGHGGFIDLLFPVRIGSWKRFFLLHTKLAKFWNAFFSKKKKGDASIDKDCHTLGICGFGLPGSLKGVAPKF